MGAAETSNMLFFPLSSSSLPTYHVRQLTDVDGVVEPRVRPGTLAPDVVVLLVAAASSVSPGVSTASTDGEAPTFYK